MASSYPSSLDSYPTRTDKEDIYEAAHMNEMQSAIVAIETELGTDVAGSKTDLKTRLAVALADTGAFQQGTSFPVSPVEGQGFWNTSSKLFYIYDATATEWKLLSGVPTAYVPGATSKLFIPCKGIDGGTSIIDVGGTGHTLTRNGSILLSTDQYKWADSSLEFNGSSQYIDIADSADWDIFATKTEDWTVSFWVKHTDHAGNECYIEQFEDSPNKWRLRHADGSGIELVVASGGSGIITLTGAGEITDTSWHHIVFVKIGDASTPEYAIYLDGTQVSYVADSSQLNITGSLNIGNSGDASHYFAGFMEQIIIEQSNIYGAAPNSSLADTITVPTSEETPSGGGDGQSEVVTMSAGAIKRWVKR